MAEFEFDNEAHIVIGSSVYQRTDLTDEMRAAISHINHTDQELATAEHNIRVMRLGRDQMVAQLVEKVGDLTPVAVVPDEPPAPPAPPAPEKADA